MADKVVRALSPEELNELEKGAAQKVAPPRFVGKKPKEDEKFPLEYPLEFDGTTYETATLHALHGRDFKKFRMLSAMGVEHETIFAHLVSGLPIEVIDAMEAGDYTDLMEKIEGFIPARFLKEVSEQPSQTGPSSQAS